MRVQSASVSCLLPCSAVYVSVLPRCPSFLRVLPSCMSCLPVCPAYLRVLFAFVSCLLVCPTYLRVLPACVSGLLACPDCLYSLPGYCLRILTANVSKLYPPPALCPARLVLSVSVAQFCKLSNNMLLLFFAKHAEIPLPSFATQQR
jgi:hypothetical protein